MRRREFLLGSVVITAGAAAGSVSCVLRRGRGDRPSDAASAAGTAPQTDPLFSPEDEVLLLAVADLIVPREGDLPAASEIGLVPRLERWVRSSDHRLGIYERGWPALRERIAKVPVVDGRPNPTVLAKQMRFWHRNYRRFPRNRRAVRFFEQLRRDVLRVYYASPAGWAAVGYGGPVHRPHPRGDRDA